MATNNSNDNTNRTTIKRTGRLRVAVLVTLALSALGIGGIAPSVDAATTAYLRSNGTLVLSGDGSKETFDVSPDDNDPDNLLVTVYRGSSLVSRSSYPEESIKRIDARTRGGDDTVFLIDLDIPGSVTVDGGNGWNTVQLTRTMVGGKLTVKDSAGLAVVHLHDSWMRGGTLINGGNDLLQIFASGTAFSGRTDIKVSGSNGRMSTSFRNNQFNGETKILGANKIDKVSITDGGAAAGRVTVDLKGGTDELQILGHDFRNVVNVKMGNGNDVVDVWASRFRRSTTFNGNAGRDQIHGEGNNFQGPTRVLSFEVQ
ncbi:MAG: hypothetical protein AAF547_19070 [Actinomycetota bacterium]